MAAALSREENRPSQSTKAAGVRTIAAAAHFPSALSLHAGVV